MNEQNQKINTNSIPTRSGVYLFYDNKQNLLYIGKAKNLRKRVSSYFQKKEEHSFLKRKMVSEIASIKFRKAESDIDALILESRLIKKNLPKYNVALRDDKNFFFVGVSGEEFPRVFITHRPLENKSIKRKNNKHGLKSAVRGPQSDYIGPFTDGGALKKTLRLLRKIFPYRHCEKMPKILCLQYHLNRCGGFCGLRSQKLKLKGKNKKIRGKNADETDNIIKKQYAKDISRLMSVLTGRKQAVLKKWEEEMKREAKKENFEKAAEIKGNIFALQKTFSHSFLFEGKQPDNYQKIAEELREILSGDRPNRIEVYDISNISGKSAVGSMVVFEKGKPKKSGYRIFNIKTKNEPNDPAMMKEIVFRRLRHPEWPLPDAIIVDGGTTQLNAAKKALFEAGLDKKTKICSIAKNPDRIFIGRKKISLKKLRKETELFLRRARDEAHRFAVSGHRRTRDRIH